MRVVNVLPTMQVADFEVAVTWYETLFGRPPDRRPMDGLVEWHLTDTGGIQVYQTREGAGATSVVIAVDDVDGLVAELTDRGLSLEAATVPSGQFRLAPVHDPGGNTIVFSQELGGP
jgi:predicted enzyme related to lactoylglutathione lyase